MKTCTPTPRSRRSIWRPAFVLVLLPSLLVADEPSVEEDDEEPIILSPFEVSADADSGYYASQTLAGGRINSQLEDIGTSIQVVTEELLNDVGAKRGEEILLYTTNTDVAGPGGNASGVVPDRGAQSDQAIRENAAATNRIRGLASADLTRSFFRTNIPFDSYNSGRLDILRGANSFLFGLGSPGGILNYSLDRATFKNSGEIGFRFSNEGLEDNFSRRYDINVNRVLIKDRVAVRVAGLLENEEYIQKPANRDTERLYGTVTARLFENRNIFLRISGETGQIDTTPPSALGPLENLSTFLQNPSGINFGGPANRWIGDPYTYTRNDYGWQGLDANGNKLNFYRGQESDNSLNRKWGLIFDGTEDAAGHPTRAFQTGIGATYWDTGNVVFDPNSSLVDGHDVYFNGYPNLFDLNPGWLFQGLTDYRMFDFRKRLISGNADQVKHDFENININLEATGFDDQLGVELVYNREIYERDSIIVVGSPTLQLDLNRTLPVGPNSLFGDLNPNFGRIFFTGFGARPNAHTEREAYRATAFAKLDFEKRWGDTFLRWFGRHQFTALVDRDERNQRDIQRRLYSFGNNAGYHLDQPDATLFQRQAPPIFYVSDAFPSAFTDPSFDLNDFNIRGIRGNANLNFTDDLTVPVAYFDLGGPGTGDETVQVANHNPRFAVGDARMEETVVQSYAVNSQSFLFNDHLVINLGLRQDEWRNRRTEAPPDATNESIRNLDPSVFTLDGIRPDRIKDTNFSYNAVLKVPSKWTPGGWGLSFHYGESSNFVPSLSGSDVDGSPVPSSSGESKDYGFTVSSPDDRVVVRVNWYEAELANELFPPVDFGFAWTAAAHLARMYGNMQVELWNVDQNGDGRLDSGDANGNGLYDSLENNGNTYMSIGQLSQLADRYGEIFTPFLREVGGYTFTPGTQNANGRASYGLGSGIFFALDDTADVRGEGLEIEAIVNPSPSWRIALSVVQQKASRSNLAPRFTALFEAIVAAHEAVPNSKGATINANKLRTPVNANELAGGTLWNRLTLNPNSGGNYYPNVSLEGADNPEVREWRWNVVTNYSFRQGRLKGWSVGGAYRYTDKAAIGYALKLENGALQQDVTRPYFDEAEHVFDAWTGYSFRLGKDIDWRIQLNVRNLLADSDPRVILRQPDGSPARVRYAPPRTFILQNTLSF